MSFGTPAVVASNQAVAGVATTLVATLTANVSKGEAIAVWITSNLATVNFNLNPVSDSQGNVYSATSGIFQGTGIAGAWWICPASKAAMVSGTDTITLTCSTTAGAKTLEAIACTGVIASSPLDVLAPAIGTSLTPSTTSTALNNANELVLVGEANAANGNALTFGGNFVPTVTDQAHATGTQFANVGAQIVTTKAAITSSNSLAGTSANWVQVCLTVLPASGGSNLTGLVGFTIPKQAYTQSACYDAQFSTQDQCDNLYIANVKRSLPNGHPSFTKKFWFPGPDVYTTTNNFNNIQNYLNYGTFVLMALSPPMTGFVASDQTALATFLSQIKALGYNSSNCHITLWQEPENSQHFGAHGSAAYQAALQFFGPIVNQSGLPLVIDVGMGAGDSVAQSFYNASLATTCTFAAGYVDYYFGAWSNGTTLTNIQTICDNNNLPFGVGELGCHAADNYTGYLNYIIGFFQARLAAGKKNSNLEYYNGQCSPVGAGDLTSPILTPTDPRIPLLQNMFDTLTSPVVTNRVTVTSPGNQTSTINVAISPLTIVATDSDATQSLTFSATGLPTGIVISASGVITGTPTVAGSYSVTVTATDGTGASGSAGFTWNVSVPVTNTVTVANPGTQSTIEGALTSLTLTATDSNPAITSFTWAAAGLPPGLVMSSSSGTISGTPNAIGTFSVSVSATDSTGSVGTANFSWQITNPNIMPHGAFTTLPPLNPSPIAGLGLANELSYEVCLGLTAGVGSTTPFAAVTLQFYDFDELPALQTPVAIVTYRCPMGTNNDPNGPAVTYGRGPQRGAYMRVQVHNVDTVDATLQFYQMVGTAREVDRDDWRWDAGGNAPVIPGFTNAIAAPASLVLAGLSGPIPANGSLSVLCSMFAGKVYVRCHANTGNAGPINIQIAPQPASLFSSQSLLNENVAAGTELFTSEVALPRGPCLLTLSNSSGSSIGGDAEIIAVET